MIRIMIVDDELPALKMAESVLKTFDDVSICGMFTDPDELLTCLPTTDVDLILVDMKMPGIHGLELAGRIQELKYEPAIVFVTAYDDYAVDAFEKDALDYILKPITAERLQKTFERYKKRSNTFEQVAAQDETNVRSFGRFCVEAGKGHTVKFRTAKSEELLAYLLHQRGNSILKEKIVEELWYDRDADRAQAMFYTTIYQLRKDLESIGIYGVIQNSRKDGGICRLLWLPEKWDYMEFVGVCQKNLNGEFDIEDSKRIVGIYKNGYLTDNGYMWSEARKNELELNCAELLEKIVEHDVQMQKFESALVHLKRWAEISPYSENIHFKIVSVYLLMNNKAAAKNYYLRTKELFAEELGVPLQIDMDVLVLNPRLAFNDKRAAP